MNLENLPAQQIEAWHNVESALRSKGGDSQTVSAVLTRVQSWAGQQPFLARLVCGYVLANLDVILRTTDLTVIDGRVNQKIINNWKRGDAAGHLKQIQKSLLAYEIRDSLLILYLQILKRNSVPKNDSPEQALLLRTGLAKVENDRLRLGNAIYPAVFNEAWIEQQLPGITRPVSIIRGSSPIHQAASSSPSAGSSQGKLPVSLNKSALVACGLAAIALIALIYLQRSGDGNQATTSQLIDSANAETTAPSANQNVVQLTLLGDTFSGYSTFRDDDFQSGLQTTGLTVSYADEFDQALRAKKLSSGEADLIVTTLDQFLKQQPQGKIVGLLDRTIGADAVVLNTKQYSQLNSLLDLEKLVQQAKSRGEKLSITYAADTASEYLALVLDTQFDTFNLSDFTLRPVADASEALSLMQNPEEKVAIAVLWEPYVAQARQQGYSVVLSSQDAPNVIVDVLVASDKVMNANPEAISQLLEKYYRRIDANIRDASQLQAQVAKDGNLSASDAASVISGIDFFTATEARNWLSNGTLTKRLESTAAILTLSDQLKGIPVDPENLYSAKFVIEAANNTQALINLVEVDNPELAAKLAGTSPTVLPTKRPSQDANSKDIGNVQVRGQVSFDRDSAQLTEEGKQTINKLASELQGFNEKTVAVRIIGHTSRSGDAKMNQALSQERAETVAKQLRADGVLLNVQAEGKGFSEPLSGKSPEDASNQRTEIRLVRVQ